MQSIDHLIDSVAIYISERQNLPTKPTNNKNRKMPRRLICEPGSNYSEERQKRQISLRLEKTKRRLTQKQISNAKH